MNVVHHLSIEVNLTGILPKITLVIKGYTRP